jgi:hypothetical protein
LRSPCRLRRILEGRHHGAILRDDGVRSRLRLDDPGPTHRLDVEIERRVVAAKVHAHGVVAEELLEHGREEMLAGVLLHVVESPLPLHGSMDGAIAAKWALHEVRDALSFVDDVGDTRAAQGTEIMRLATRGRIERGLVEIDAASVVRHVDDASVELGQI